MALACGRAASVFAAAAVVGVTLQGCGDRLPTTVTTTSTMTTTFGCPQGHIPWPHTGSPPITCQSLEDVTKEANAFLKANAPPWDTDNYESLKEGILGPTVTIALTARDVFPWAEDVPKDIWLNYVLPYANVNEPRVDWRTLLSNKVGPVVQNPLYQAQDIAEVVSVVNEQLWSVVRPDSEIKFKGGQTPLIYDPMSVIDYGFASCTGISIMLVDALRSVGVPARIAGTPAWHGNVSDGNHNWVEVWLGPGKGLHNESWSFLEGKPAGANESLTNPCDKWFCNPAHFNKTMAFAPQFDTSSNTTVYPMAWDLDNLNIPGVNRTDYYNALCQPCGKTSTADTILM